MLFGVQNNGAIALKDAEILYDKNFLTIDEATTYFNVLRKETDWQQDRIKVFGKVYDQPRLTALFANNKNPYSYSNITMYPTQFSPVLLEIKYSKHISRNLEMFSNVLAEKLESYKGKKPLYITLGENKAGEAIIIVNTAKPGKGGRQDKRSYEPNADGNYYQQIAYQLTEANKQLDGTGIKNVGDRLNPRGKDLEAMDLGELTLKDVSSKEIRDIYTKEQVLDTLAALSRSVVEKRQSVSQAAWQKDIVKSAFGQTNFKMIIDYADRVQKDKQNMYDPRYPDKNRTISDRQKEINKGDEVNIGQLTSLKFDTDAAGLKGWGQMKVSRRVGDILQDSYREFNKSILGSISDALVKNMMLNPIPHMHNELIHYYSTLGATKSAKASGAGLWNVMFGKKDQVTKWSKDGEWAQRQVLERTPEYIKLIESGM